MATRLMTLDVLTPSPSEDPRYTWNGTVYSALREEIQSLGLWRLARRLTQSHSVVAHAAEATQNLDPVRILLDPRCLEVIEERAVDLTTN